MKPIDLISKIPSGSPAGEILKIVTIIAATVLVDKVGEIVKDVTGDNPQKLIDIEYKED